MLLVLLATCLCLTSSSLRGQYKRGESDAGSPVAPTLYYTSSGTNAILNEKNMTMTLTHALHSKIVVYFLHQRKCGGSTIRQYLFRQLESTKGNASRSYVPCFTTQCNSYDLDVRMHFLGDLSLVAGHMSYHVPIARRLFGEEQVLITNFRHPSVRIRSCLKFRFPELTREYFDVRFLNFTLAKSLLFDTSDEFGDSCAGEAIRTLTPFNPSKRVPTERIEQACRFVVSSVHNIFLEDRPKYEMSAIESELHDVFSKDHENKNNETFSPRVDTQLQIFVQKLATGNAAYQSELELYECVREARRKL